MNKKQKANQYRRIFNLVETWVVVLALENFSEDQVLGWNRAQWLDFYARIKLGGK